MKKPVGTRFREWANVWLTSVFAGLSPKALRKMFRGEPPGRPNPRLKVHTNSFWFHMRPRWYPKSVTRFSYTFALGWSSVFLAVVLGITGIVLMLFYTPSTDVAYFDMLNIMGNIPFGKLMRDLHRLGAELMVAIVMLHMLRVFVTGSYKQPRSFNWTVGVVLLLITWLFSYSGYLLPWDQLAYWAVTIGTSMADAVPRIGPQIMQLLLGGPEVGQLGLLRFYMIHVILLPVALAVMFGVHYYKVVRQGISLPPAVEAEGKKDERVPFLPTLLIRDVLWVALFTLIMVVAVITFFSAPLEDHANPFMTPLHSTAPWYFLWIQGLIKLPDIFGGLVEGKFIYGIALPGLVIGLLFALPYLDRNPSRRWQDRKLMLAGGAVAVVLWGVLTWMGSPAYKVQAAPTEELALEFVPYDREGEIHELDWDDLANGVYDVSAGATQVNESDAPADLLNFLQALQEAVGHEAEELPNGVTTLTITTWQRNLKRVDLDIVWESDGVEHTFNQHTYIHKDTIH